MVQITAATNSIVEINLIQQVMDGAGKLSQELCNFQGLQIHNLMNVLIAYS